LHLRMKAISLISTEKVDMLPSILSSVDTLAKRLCVMGKAAYCAGTNEPICAITCRSATVRK